MRPALLLLLLLVLTVPVSSIPHRTTVAAPVPESDEIIVGWDADYTGAAKTSSSDLASAYDLEELPALGLVRLGASRFRVRGSERVSAVVARIAMLPGVRYAEPNVAVFPAEVPTDPLYAGVDNVPTDLQRWTFGGIGDNRVLNAEAAWDITTGDSSIVIAVLDSGLDLDNPEFQRVWVNHGEVAGNGVDDDDNGYVDDVNGYDFHNRRGDVNPDLGDGIDNDGNGKIDDTSSHGTISASLIGAAHDGAGMAGGAPGCTLMVVKIFGDDGGVKLSDLAEAIQYAADNGADVVSLSLATLFRSDTLLNAVRYALDRKAILVAAAGNGNSAAMQFPASYNLVVSVGGSGSGFSTEATAGATDLGRLDGRWPNSQFGLGAVDVVAPAVVLGAAVATVGYNAEHPDVAVGDTYHGVFEGTSFAAPYVSALAGLIASHDKAIHGKRTLSPADVLALLERTATDLPRDGSVGPAWDGHGRVNYLAALLGIPGAGDPAPVIERVAFGKKQLRVIGDGFSRESQIEVNGTVVPSSIVFSYVDRLIYVEGSRKQLGLEKKGTNHIVVIERGVRSPEVIY